MSVNDREDRDPRNQIGTESLQNQKLQLLRDKSRIDSFFHCQESTAFFNGMEQSAFQVSAEISKTGI